MSTSKQLLHKWAYRVEDTGYDLNSGAINEHLVNSGQASSSSTVTYGDNYSNWRDRIRLHLDATTVLSGYRRSKAIITEGLVTQFRTSDGRLRRHYVGNLLVPFALQWIDPSSGVDATADNKARSKFLSNYIKKTNTWRGGNFLAEIRETIHMVRHPLQSFYHETWSFAGRVGKLGKTYRKNPTKYSKALADAWLAYAFGVKPLISDIDDARQALSKLASGTGSDTTTVSGFGHNSSQLSWLDSGIPFVTGDPGNNTAHDAIQVNHFTVRYKFGLRSRPESPRTVAQNFGVDVFDVIPAVWEAIPWSFFIDYFANVGEELDAMRLWGADFTWGFRTVRNSTALTRRRIHPLGPVGSLSTSASGGGGFFTLSTYVNRTPSGVPYPKFHFQMPNFPSLKWLNIAALARQCYGSK